MNENKTTELYRVLRPKDYNEVYGQPEAIEQLQGFDRNSNYPHAMLFHGPSGTGKTTLIRIIKDKLGCGVQGDPNKFSSDYIEINAAEARGIDTIREIKDKITLRPMTGRSRIWVFDECHSLTSDAQNAALKMWEDIPPHVYFLLATTNLKKVLDTVKTRCTKIALKPVSPDQMKAMLLYVATKEPKAKVPNSVLEKIIDVANGSPRDALVILNQVMGLGSEKLQLESVQKLNVQEDAFKIVKALLWGERPKWADLAAIISKIEEEAEAIRRMVLACAKNEILKANKNAPRAFRIITAFECSYPWDSGQSGVASLCRACYECCS